MSLLKSLKKRILPAVAGFVTGGPAGAAVAVLGTLKKKPGIAGPAPPGRVLQIPSFDKPFPITQGSMLGALPQIARGAGQVIRSLPGAGRVGAAGGAVVAAGRGLARRFPRSAKALRDLGLVASGGLVFDAAGNIVGQRAPARRINPMNVKAARRAVRRIRAARTVCQAIESSLPKRKSATACAPAFTRRKRKC